MASEKISDEKAAYKELNFDDKGYGCGIRHLQLACMSICITALFVVRSSMGVAVLAMTDKSRQDDGLDIYTWDKKIQGYILSSFFCGYAIMQVPAGLLAKKFGGKPVLLFALIGNGLLCFSVPILAKLGGWPLVCVARIMMGLAQACTVPSMHTLLGRWFPGHEVTSLSGFVYGSTNLGVIISLPVSGLLAGTALGWKLIFYFTGALLLIVSIFWWWFSASSPGEHRMMSFEEKLYIEKDMSHNDTSTDLRVPWKELFTCKGLWAILIPHLAFVIAYIFFFVDLPTYFEKGLNISLKDSAILSALPYVGNLFGTLFSTYFCDILVNNKWLSMKACRKMFTTLEKSIRSYMGTLMGTAIPLMSLLFVDVRYKNLIISILVLLFTLQSFIAAGTMINHLDLSPNFAGVMLSLCNCPANVGSFFTPIVTSAVLRNDPTDISRWRVVFMMVASICIAANIVYLIFGTAERQPWDAPAYFDKKNSNPEEMVAVLKKEKDDKDFK